ncbi:MAG TPA: ferrochelatase [Polyangiaceae bacterium]|nr:ferrochelatase [Polyangiaceae bacterium]
MSPPLPRTGILLAAHGTVENLADLPAFLARIRHGRPPPPGLVEELARRYEAIGGSPLLRVTEEQARALEARTGLPVLLGMRLWEPSVEGAFREAAQRGITRLVLVPLAPFSVEVYGAAAQRSLEAVRSELNEATPELVSCEPWGTEPAFVEAHVAALGAALRIDSRDSALMLTAHSLPRAAIRAGDRYQAEVEASARAIAERVGRPCELAYQSQGADGGEWLGPDLRQTFERLARSGVRQITLSPFGFLADHVETLYDLDIEARAWAAALGLGFERVPALNSAPGLIDALASVALRALAGAAPPTPARATGQARPAR